MSQSASVCANRRNVITSCTKATRLERDEVLAWSQGPAAFEEAHRRKVSNAQIAPLAPDDFD